MRRRAATLRAVVSSLLLAPPEVIVHDARRRPTRWVLAWFGLMLLARPAASSAQIAMDIWTVDDGLPQNSVYDIRHTRDGYLWLGTLGGLARFDGVRFVNFDRATAGIGSLRVRSLHESADGTLWAGTEDGMLIRYRDGRFRTYGAAEGLEAEHIFRIEDGADGALWLTSDDRTTRFDGQRFDVFKPGELPRAVRPVPRSGGWRGIWWSQDGDGIHCLTGGRVTLCLPAPRLPARRVSDVSVDRDGAFWFHLDGGGAVRARGDDIRSYALDRGLPAGTIAGPLYEDPDGIVWASDPGARTTVRVGDGSVEQVRAETICIYRDREGSVWLGTTTGGLHRVRSRAVSMLSREDGLSSGNVYALLGGPGATAWVGTWGGGLDRRSADASVVTFGRSEGLPSPYVTSLLQERSGRRLVGTTEGVAAIEDDRLSPYPDPTGWLGLPVWVMHEDTDGTLWFGTPEGLVRQRSGETGRYTVADGLPHDEVTALLRSRDGDLWVGTRRGLARLRDGRLTAYTEADGFVGNQVRALAEHGGAIWAGTYDGGLYRLAGGRLTRFTTAQGLHDNGVFQLIEDGRGHFWAGSNRGIARLRIAELEAVAEGRSDAVHPLVLGLEDGLATLECNGGRQPSGLRMPDGTVWIPTQGGIAVVDPRLVPDGGPPPPVRVEAIRINGRTTPFDDRIELGADEDTVEFDYSAPSFVKPAQVRFRYRLAGLHDDWVEAGTRRTAAYHQVPPGEYRLEVVATSGNGEWSADPAALAIVIHAPLWRQAWVQALAGAGLVTLAILVVLRRSERLRRERDRQRAYARQVVDAQEQERRRVSNDLHDSLGQTLFMIRQRARAMAGAASEGEHQGHAGAVAELASRAIAEMKEIAHALRPYQLDKIGLTGTLTGMLARVRETYGLEVVADIDDIDDAVPPEARIDVYRIVQEGVSNIVRHAGATEAVVRVQRQGRGLEIEIWDNGAGFIAADRADDGGGLGLTTMRERARALNGVLRVKSTRGDGTTVTVRLEPPAANG